MEWCTMVYNSKSGAQCGKWCTNALILLFLMGWCTNAPEEVHTHTHTHNAKTIAPPADVGCTHGAFMKELPCWDATFSYIWKQPIGWISVA